MQLTEEQLTIELRALAAVSPAPVLVVTPTTTALRTAIAAVERLATAVGVKVFIEEQ